MRWLAGSLFALLFVLPRPALAQGLGDWIDPSIHGGGYIEMQYDEGMFDLDTDYGADLDGGYFGCQFEWRHGELVMTGNCDAHTDWDDYDYNIDLQAQIDDWCAFRANCRPGYCAYEGVLNCDLYGTHCEAFCRGENGDIDYGCLLEGSVGTCDYVGTILGNQDDFDADLGFNFTNQLFGSCRYDGASNNVLIGVGVDVDPIRCTILSDPIDPSVIHVGGNAGPVLIDWSCDTDTGVQTGTVGCDIRY